MTTNQEEQKLLIIFSGSGRKSGKTTLALLFKKFFDEKLSIKTKIYSFADIPRKIASIQLSFLEQFQEKVYPTRNKEKEDYYFEKLKNDKESSPQQLLQSINYRNFLISVAESIRFTLDENIWTGLLSEQILNDMEKYDVFIIDDHRKQSEYEIIKQIFPGKIIRIYIDTNKEQNENNYFEGEIKKEECDIILNNKNFNISGFIEFANGFFLEKEEKEQNIKQKEKKDKKEKIEERGE